MVKVRLDVSRGVAFDDGTHYDGDHRRQVELPADKADLVRRSNIGAIAGVAFTTPSQTAHACHGVICRACGFHAFWPGTCPKCGGTDWDQP